MYNDGKNLETPHEGEIDQQLIGRFFHSLHKHEDGCEVADWQGRVLAEVSPGVYLVETYSWASGLPYLEYLVPISKMLGWQFYPTSEQMTDMYNTVLDVRSEVHSRHERSNGASS